MKTTEMLKFASDTAIHVVTCNRAYYVQLAMMDRRTKDICLRFFNEPAMEPDERILISEQLSRIQVARKQIVQTILEFNKDTM